MTVRSSRAPLVAFLAAAVVFFSGCKVEPRVDIDVAADGSGTVTVVVDLDAEAATRLGDPSGLRLDDLRATGWDVRAPDTSGGGLRLAASKTFRSGDDLAGVLAEVGGRDGLFRDVGLSIDDSWRRTAYQLSGRLVSTGAADQFSDSGVAAALDGLPLGRTADELSAEGGGTPIDLVVTVRLPGADEPAKSTIVVAGGSESQVDIATSSEAGKSGPAGWFGLAAIAAAVAVVSLMAARSRSVPVSSADDSAASD